VGVAVYPSEVTIGSPARSDDAINAIIAPITTLTPEGGRMRVRVGELTAEVPRADVDRLRLRPGEPARAVFSPAHARLIALDSESV